MAVVWQDVYHVARLLSLYTSLGVALLVAVFLILPFFLALITLWRSSKSSSPRSALYSGRVWHKRLRPVEHAFRYPLFLFLLDVEEVERGLFQHDLWPLSLIMSFREGDHLKNGEGLDSNSACSISQRIQRLVSVKTRGALVPTSETHSILLLTHLCYYGYCFNPVSIYFIQNQKTDLTDAIVLEVSNTPWNEMHCYVLHPKSVDRVTVKANGSFVTYTFPKSFHVSPFMEMDYTYNWTFADRLLTSDDSKEKDSTTIDIRADMQNAGSVQFRAGVHIQRQSLHPFCAAWHLTTYPIYCLIIQLWIHYEALWLFFKGVAYQPHPQGSETTASRLIGNLMIPFFAMKDFLTRKMKTS